MRHAAKRLGISDTLAYELAKRGTFPSPVIRAGKRYLVPRAPLEELLTTGRIAAKGDRE